MQEKFADVLGLYRGANIANEFFSEIADFIVRRTREMAMNERHSGYD